MSKVTNAARLDQIKKAKEAGLVPIVGNKKTLLLDLDNMESFVLAEFYLGRYKERLKIRSYAFKPSKTKNHFHIVVSLYEPIEDPKERILLQLAFGSDKAKELYSYNYIQNKDPFPIVLFSKPGKFEIKHDGTGSIEYQ